MTTTPRISILSVDGGGIRGILPGTILEYIEDELRRLDGNDRRLADYFDLVAGTSTGGILSLALLVPGPDGRPLYTAHEATQLYINEGGRIFTRSLWQKISTAEGLNDEKYHAGPLEEVLNKYFGDARLGDLLRPCLVTAYEIEKRHSVFFTSVKARNNPQHNYLVRDAARATSAAPTYFEPAAVRAEVGPIRYLIDGAMFANNPAMCAYSEARTLAFGELPGMAHKPNLPMVRDMLMLSLGTGEELKSLSYQKMRDAGLVSWIQPIIDILMSGNAETVHYQLKQLFATANSAHYLRLQPNLDGLSLEIDEAGREHILQLRRTAEQFVEQNQGQLDMHVELLRRCAQR